MCSKFVQHLVICLIVMMTFLYSSRAFESRDKRQVIVNPFANFKFGFLANAPISLILPTLVGENKLGFNKRSLDSGPEGNSFSESFADHESAENLFVDPGYGRQMDKLMTFFALLEVGQLACQERLICEVAVETETYSPVSELLLRELKQSHGPVTQSKDSLMWRYMAAAREGIVADEVDACKKQYFKCPHPAYELLDMPVIKVWQFISSKINLKLM